MNDYDRPQFNLTISPSESITMRDALVLANFAAEGNWTAVADFINACGTRAEIGERDRLRDRIHELTLPWMRAEADKIRRHVEEAKAERDREIATDVEDYGLDGF